MKHADAEVKDLQSMTRIILTIIKIIMYMTTITIMITNTHILTNMIMSVLTLTPTLIMLMMDISIPMSIRIWK